MGTRLFIGNLSYNVNEQELREAFTGEGIEVRSVRVALDRDTGRPRGFAFVETATDEGAKASIEKLSGRLLQGRSIVIEEAQAKPGGPGGAPAGAVPRAPGGGFGPAGGSPPPAGAPARTGGGGFGPPGGAATPGGAPAGGPPRGGGFGPPRPPGSPPPPRAGGGGGFGPPRPFGGGGGPGGGPFDPRFQGGPGGAPGRSPGSGDAPPRRERPEKKKSTRPKPEERERGNWRWNGKVDED
ncbi:MAG TPA: RNA-binding protein [Polyangia bacterium]|nr:RNA-binding protein [Polyangia bacterium]